MDGLQRWTLVGSQVDQSSGEAQDLPEDDQ